MNKVILSICSILLFIGCESKQQEQKVNIRGTFSGYTKAHSQDKVFMYTRGRSDSSTVEGGDFSFELPFKKPMVKFFYIKRAQKSNMAYQPFPLLIDQPGTITIKGNIKKGFNDDVKVSGSPATELYLRYQKKEAAARKKVSKRLKGEYGAAWLKSKDPEYESFQHARDSLSSVYVAPLVKNLVKEHPDNYASVFIMSSKGRNLLDVKEQRSAYNLLSDRMKQTGIGQDIDAHIHGMKKSTMGTAVADFELPGPDEKPVDFNRFKGNYVMIDFWASWCVPCRKSFPRMRQVYNQFKDDGFEIYSVSIDKDKQAWLKAVKDEQNPWPQSLDTKNIAASQFAVTAVPTAYLIDPNGKITMKEIGFDPEGGGKIEKKLENLYDEKVPRKKGSSKENNDESVPAARMN